MRWAGSPLDPHNQGGTLGISTLKHYDVKGKYYKSTCHLRQKSRIQIRL